MKVAALLLLVSFAGLGLALIALAIVLGGIVLAPIGCVLTFPQLLLSLLLLLQVLLLQDDDQHARAYSAHSSVAVACGRI